jgi:hypothetical protein
MNALLFLTSVVKDSVPNERIGMTVEAWGRSATNPIKGWYGLKKGLRGRFGVYIPPLLEALGLCDLEHNSKNNRMRSK